MYVQNLILVLSLVRITTTKLHPKKVKNVSEHAWLYFYPDGSAREYLFRVPWEDTLLGDGFASDILTRDVAEEADMDPFQRHINVSVSCL